jgi:benzoyl-CoA reductase/2-hydroxyglutaryl-CoA dehydratase subunit BcrC/BadD/HgdB
LNPQTSDRLAGRSAAIVYIDCDLYASTKHVLQFVKQFLVDGTIVCFDDYYNYKANPEQGEQLAVKEFLEEQNEVKFIGWFDYSPLGKSFIVRRNEPQNRRESRSEENFNVRSGP